MNMSRRPQQPRVVADGWGRQASGSVFCADSSLRYIFESPLEPPPPGTTAAAITSLASGEFDHKASTVSTPSSSTAVHGKSLAYPSSYDKLTTPNNNSWSLMSANMVAAKLDPTSGSSGRGADGVDLFEAQIARACAQITKQTASLPHSFRECSVCLSQNAYAQITVCGHTFHSKCFLRWFRTNRSCPLCRGPVDAVQLAPVLSVQDELEAIMAEMDDDHEPLEVADPLMTNPDLISFLGEGFDDADMDMMALEDLEAVPLAPVDKHHHHHHGDHQQCQPRNQEDDDEDMDMDDDEEEDADNQVPTPSMSLPMQQVAPPQFAPTSTMPNYWNVLNQGLSMPSVVPPPIMPAPTHQHMSLQQQHQHQHHQQQQQQQSRVVPIAPKPDGQFHAHAHHAHQHIYAHAPQAFAAAPRASSPAASTASTTPAAPRVVSCRCTGGCRNGRCACVKEGGMCGVACRCTSCKNPFLMVKAAGADIDALLQDACFMHNVSKTRDMVQRMQEPVDVPCCGTTLTVLDCVQGYTCTKCDRRFDFSWCMNKLLDHDKTPRNHCEICKRCCDHRDVHCHDCGRCYFAGVAASLPCPCKESSRKRRDHSTNASSGDLVHAATMKDDAAEGEEKEGECSIM